MGTASRHDVMDLLWEDELAEGCGLHTYLARLAPDDSGAVAEPPQPAGNLDPTVIPVLSERDIDSFTEWLWG